MSKPLSVAVFTAEEGRHSVNHVCFMTYTGLPDDMTIREGIQELSQRARYLNSNHLVSQSIHEPGYAVIECHKGALTRMKLIYGGDIYLTESNDFQVDDDGPIQNIPLYHGPKVSRDDDLQPYCGILQLHYSKDVSAKEKKLAQCHIQKAFHIAIKTILSKEDPLSKHDDVKIFEQAAMIAAKQAESMFPCSANLFLPMWNVLITVVNLTNRGLPFGDADDFYDMDTDNGDI